MIPWACVLGTGSLSVLQMFPWSLCLLAFFLLCVEGQLFCVCDEVKTDPVFFFSFTNFAQAVLKPHGFSPVFYTKGFFVSALKFKSMAHGEFILMRAIRQIFKCFSD